MNSFVKMINSLNGKSLQEVLCTYNGIELDEGPGALDEEVIESIACSFNDLDTNIMLEIIAANWGKDCRVKIVSMHGGAHCPVVSVSFDGFAIDDISFELDWMDE